MKKVIKLKEEAIANATVNQQPVPFSKKNKKRLLPDVFYLRWEIELLSALAGILVLMLLPDWLNDKVNLYLSGQGTSMNTNWISVTCNILLAFLSLYIVFRVLWLFFLRKEEGTTPGKIRLALITGQLAEIIFSLCIVILVLILLVSMIEFLSILLKNNLSGKMKNINGAGN